MTPEDQAARLQRVAFASVRHASMGKGLLLADLSPELRRRVYRSPSPSAADQAGALARNPLSKNVANAVSLVADVARHHPLWGRGPAGADRPPYVHRPSRAIRERVLRCMDAGTAVVEVGDGLVLFLALLAGVMGSFREGSEEPSERLCDLLASLAICGHPGPASVSRRGAAVPAAVEQLSTAMLLFSVARAFVHHSRGDFKTALPDPAGTAEAGVQELFFELERELDADQAALDLMARACGRAGIPGAVFTLAPFLLFEGARAARGAFARLQSRDGALDEASARRAGLPAHAAERAAALAESAAASASNIGQIAGRLAAQFDSLSAVCSGYFEGCRDLRLAVASLVGPARGHAFWLTPMARDTDGAVRPFHQIADRARVSAIQQHLDRREPLRPYLRAPGHDVVICYRASLYLDAARELKRLLRAAGVRALHDELMVPPGTDWQPVLRDAIGNARMVVMLMSLVDLGPGLVDDLRTFPVMKEMRWAGERGTPFFMAGVSHLAVDGEPGAIFRSMIDVARATADGSFVRTGFPVFMVQSEDGRLPAELLPILASDVQEELAQTM